MNIWPIALISYATNISNCGLVFPGDFNDFQTSNLLSRHNLKQLVQAPTRGSAILDLIITTLSNLYEAPQVLAPLGSSDQNIVTWSPDLMKSNPSLHTKSIKRLVRRGLVITRWCPSCWSYQHKFRAYTFYFGILLWGVELQYAIPRYLSEETYLRLNGWTIYILTIIVILNLFYLKDAVQSVCKQRLCLHVGIQNIELYSTTIYIFMILEYNKLSRHNN